MKMASECTQPQCDRKVFGHGLCNRHYQNARRSARKAQPLPIGEKTCVRCSESKAFSEFDLHAGCRDGFRRECKACMAKYQKTQRAEYRGEASRRYSLKKNFGITPEQYDQMLAEQDGKCAICKSDDPIRTASRFFSIDHDHKTGAVRGLLCSPCNSGIGMLKDDPEILLSAINYLLGKEK